MSTNNLYEICDLCHLSIKNELPKLRYCPNCEENHQYHEKCLDKIKEHELRN